MADEKDTPKEPEETGEPAAAPEADTSDPVTDKAVEDIVHSEGDDELKAQDEAAAKPVIMRERGGRFKRAWHGWWASPKRKWGSIATIAIVLIALFVVPITRWSILGVVLKANAQVTVVDNKTGNPVSGAQVLLGGARGETNADGVAKLRPHLGSHKLQASKKYYTSSSPRVLVGMGSDKFTATLVAQGRQVQVKIINKITNKPVSGVKITAAGASAKSDKNGLATVVIPSGADTQPATVSLSSYNDAKVTITAAGNMAKNTFSVVPAGKLYFLSNLNGTIDVVKTNLDGSGRTTVLAGTGKEDPNDTSLLASRDWKYLALLAKRDGDTASVYLIDTTNGDKLTTIDEGNASFGLVGWSGDKLVYTVDRSSTVQLWQSNRYALKSYDPTTGHSLLLGQTQGTGSDANNYANEYYGQPYLIGDNILYTLNWQGTTGMLNDKQAELDSIKADGTNHKTIKTFAPGSSTAYLDLTTRLYEPDGLYINFQSSGNDDYYEYDNGSVSTVNSIDDSNFYNTPYPTYLLSPSGNGTFWAEQRDGKNTLFTGTNDAKNPKQIASLSDYNPYGWFTDDYLLVSKNSSELYIMPAGGGTPLKITDYYKPAINYQGYGGGYGGL